MQYSKTANIFQHTIYPFPPILPKGIGRFDHKKPTSKLAPPTLTGYKNPHSAFEVQRQCNRSSLRNQGPRTSKASLQIGREENKSTTR